MKAFILLGRNSYAGREYLSALAGINDIVHVTALCIGGDNSSDLNAVEEDRCGGSWSPAKLSSFSNVFDILYFDTLSSPDLLEFLRTNTFDLGIQGGGIGIIKQGFLDVLNCKIINLHPGDLPNYRGCSAPEWQYIEGKKVVSTCHVIDSGIDSGPIFRKKVLNLPTNNYHAFRASVYKETASFLLEVVIEISSLSYDDFCSQLVVQDGSKGLYRKYIGDEVIKKIKQDMLSGQVETCN